MQNNNKHLLLNIIIGITREEKEIIDDRILLLLSMATLNQFKYINFWTYMHTTTTEQYRNSERLLLSAHIIDRISFTFFSKFKYTTLLLNLFISMHPPFRSAFVETKEKE